MALKAIRQDPGLTLKELSEKSGIHIVQLAKYERGVSKLENMSLKNAVTLARALDCRPEDFLPLNKK